MVYKALCALCRAQSKCLSCCYCFWDDGGCSLNTFSMLGILGHSKESETGFLLLRNLSSLKED